MFGEVEVDDPRLDDGHTILNVDIEDARHTCQREDYPSLSGNCPTAKACACPTGHDWDIVLCGNLDAPGDLFGRVGQRHDH